MLLEVRSAAINEKNGDVCVREKRIGRGEGGEILMKESCGLHLLCESKFIRFFRASSLTPTFLTGCSVVRFSMGCLA
jgi:hypothetical protein